MPSTPCIASSLLACRRAPHTLPRAAGGRRWGPCLVAALASLWLAAAARAETAAADARQLAGEAIRRLDLQTELPRAGAPLWANWRIGLSPSLIFVLMVVAALILIYLFLVYARGDLLSVWRSRFDAGDASADRAAGPQSPAEVMVTADELAREGRFVEAMHMLLLQSLADMRQHLHAGFADSLTSREILRSARLPERGRASLREIIARVEWTYFGQHPAEAADYQACRKHFGELAQALHGETPA
jgi:hypothetical protein